MSIGSVIRQLRESRKLTQEELAKSLSVSTQTVSSWELNNSTPRMGHSTTNMLKTVYQHLTDEKQKEIDQAIDRRMTALYGKPGA